MRTRILAARSGAVVQWQDRQYVGALWGQNQHSPHILTTNCQHRTHIILVPLFPNYYPAKYQYIAQDYEYSPQNMWTVDRVWGEC